MKLIPPKVDGQSVNASDYNPPVQEPQKIVLSSEQALVEADNFQMAKAAAYYSAVGNYYQDTGTVNNYVIGSISPREGIPVYSTGQKIRFVATNTNTGASVINVQGLGSGSLLNSAGGALTGGEIQAVEEIEIEYDGANWRLSNGISGLANLFHTVDDLTVSNNVAAPNTTLDFAVGRCADSNRNFIIENTVGGFNKDITTNWAAGTGNGGKASAISITASTWYYVFVLSKVDGTFDAGIDTSIIATNLLADTSGSGYTKWRRIWAIYLLPTTFIRPFIQINDYCLYVEPISSTPDTWQGGVNNTVTYVLPIIAPINIDIEAWVEMAVVAGVTAFNINFFNPNQTNSVPLGPAQQPIGAVNGNSVYNWYGRLFLVPDSSGNINWRVNNTSVAGTDITFNTLGYFDRRTK